MKAQKKIVGILMAKSNAIKHIRRLQNLPDSCTHTEMVD